MVCIYYATPMVIQGQVLASFQSYGYRGLVPTGQRYQGAGGTGILVRERGQEGWFESEGLQEQQTMPDAYS